MSEPTYKIIKDLMEEQDVSLNKLAELTGINFHTLRGYIQSGHNITLENVKKIANALGVMVSYLLGECQAKNVNDVDLYKAFQKVLDDWVKQYGLKG